MKKKRTLVIILIMLISIGFAYISTSLNIFGDLTFKESSWDVHFEELNITNQKMYSVNANITGDLTITTSGTFDLPGDYYEFEVYMVNDGTIDANIEEINVTGITDQNRDYLSYSLVYADDGTDVLVNDMLPAHTQKLLKFHVEYKQDIDEFPDFNSANLSFSFGFMNLKNSKKSFVRKLSNDDFDYTYTVKFLDDLGYECRDDLVYHAYLNREGEFTDKNEFESFDDIASEIEYEIYYNYDTDYVEGVYDVDWDGSIYNEDLVINVVYECLKYHLVINYLDNNGEVIAEAYDEYLRAYSEFEIKSPDINNMGPSDEYIVGTLDYDMEFDVTYLPASTQLTINYWNGSQKIADSYEAFYSYGANYRVPSPQINGYNADVQWVTGTIYSDTTIDVTYTPIEYILTIDYVYQNGPVAAERYTDTYHYGDSYSIISPVISNYNCSHPVVSGNMPYRNVSITVIYTLVNNTD